MRGLADKIVVITGAGGAIGRALSLRFAEAGARVVVLDRDAAAAEETVRAVRETGGRAEPLALDITDDAAIERGIAGVEAGVGPIDVLVNNAGWDRFVTFLETDPGFWERVIAINLRGPIAMHHAVLRRMAERRRGRVVNIASDAGRVGSSGEAVYSACKGGIVSFTKTLARELAGSGITLNAVCPGPTDTPLLRSFLAEGDAGRKVYEGLARAVPLKRLGKPDDIAGIVAFLASDEASYITGQVISVSGGLTMHG